MHIQDELLALYAGRDDETRRFLLTQLGSIPLGHDADVVVEHLWGEVTGGAPGVARQARRELGVVLPRAIAIEHRAPAPEPARERLVRAALAALARAVEAGAEWLDAPSADLREAASLAAGHGGAAALLARVAAPELRFSDAVALAEWGAPEALEALCRLVHERADAEPDLAMLLARVPFARALPLLEELEPRTTPGGRAAIAQALSATGEVAARALAGRLIRRREGWVTAHALAALRGAPRSEDLALVELAFALEPHEFVQVQAVKLAGFLPDGAGAGFLVERLRSGTPRLQAAALEALVRARVPRESYAALAAPVLASPFVRARANAILALAPLDPARVAGPLDELLMSPEQVCRLEAAWLLGHVSAGATAATLAELAASDPGFPVRAQAVKSLVLQPVEVAAERLWELAVRRGDADRAVARLSARALGCLPAAALPLVTARWADAAARPVDAGIAGAVLRSMGRLAAARAGSEGGATSADAGAPPGALVEALADAEPRVVRGALRGLQALGDAGHVAAVAALRGHADAGIACRAAVAAVLAGELEAVDRLAIMLGDAACARSALTALLEACVLVRAVAGTPMFTGLSEAVRGFAEGAPAAAAGAPAAPPPVVAPVALSRPVRLPMGDPEARRAQLAQLLADAPGSRSGLSRRLTLKNAAAVSDLGLPQLQKGWRQWSSEPLARAALGIALAVAVLVVAWPSPARGPAPAAVPRGALKAGELIAIGVTGEVRVQRAGREHRLRAGDVWLTGDRIAAGAGGTAAFRDLAGNALVVRAGAAVALGEPPPRKTGAPPLVLEAARGDLDLDFARDRTVQLGCGPSRVVASDARLELREAAGRPRVSVLAGTARLDGGRAATSPVAAGGVLELDAH